MIPNGGGVTISLATPLVDSNAVLADADSSIRSPDFQSMQQPAELARLVRLQRT